MKIIRINAHQVGLVFRNGAYLKTLTEGTHWLLFNQEVKLYNMTEAFMAPCHLNILLQDNQLADMLHIVEVKANELVLQYENGLFRGVLPMGRYAFWKSVVQYEFLKVDLSKIDITEPIEKVVLTSNWLMPYVRSYVVESYEQGVLFVNGKFQTLLDAGTYYWWKNSTTIHVTKADTRLLQLEISGQEILTKDKAALRINFHAQYKVTDIQKAVLENKDHEKQVYTLMQLALREYVGTLTLDELLEKKEGVAPFILESVKGRATGLGVLLVGCGIRDVILPGDMKDIMNQVLVAEKKAQANSIMRREETASTRSLLNTAKLMEENEMLFRLKEMEYVEKIADKVNSISVTGGGQILEQLKQIFVAK